MSTPLPLAAQTELRLLGAAALIGLLQICWAATASQQQRGFAWGVGPRDEQRSVTGVAARLQRAAGNFLETFPLFAAATLAVVALGHAGSMAVSGAWLYVVARALYVPLYAAGIPVVRSLVWFASLIGIVQELAALL